MIVGFFFLLSPNDQESCLMTHKMDAGGDVLQFFSHMGQTIVLDMPQGHEMKIFLEHLSGE